MREDLRSGFDDPCRSALARERGGHGTIRLPAVGARLRANAAGTERNSAVRPQGRFLGVTNSMRCGRFVRKRTPTAGTRRARNVNPRFGRGAHLGVTNSMRCGRFVRKRTPTGGTVLPSCYDSLRALIKLSFPTSSPPPSLRIPDHVSSAHEIVNSRRLKAYFGQRPNH